jgi:hypothetical protein
METVMATDFSLNELLTQTTTLRIRFEQTQPDSARLPILIRDELRLRRLLERAA